MILMKNVKYIGIRGHRGSGKNTIAYLLGNIIQWLLDNHMTDNGLDVTEVYQLACDSRFVDSYRSWCESIKRDETGSIEEMNTASVYLESFGDTPRILLQLITNIPSEFFNSDYYKDHIVVNLKDFTWRVDEYLEKMQDVQIYTSEDFINNKTNLDNIDKTDMYMTLREFIIYFAQVCMRHLGQSVWVKSMRCSDSESFDDYYNIGTQYKIFRDIKAPSELNYIKEHDGVIIKVDRPNFKKQNGGVESLSNDNRFDYNVVITEDITTDEKLMSNLIKIAISII